MNVYLKIIVGIILSFSSFSEGICQRWLTESDSIVIEENKENKLYKGLQESASKRSWTKRLHSFVFRNPNPGKVLPNNKPNEEAYIKYNGKIIRNINIVTLNPFGTNIRNIEKDTDEWLLKYLNSTHKKTQNFIVYNNLLFKKGDAVNPVIIAESEKFLRDLSYINDARIVLSSTNHKDSVDAMVIVRDVWSVGFEINRIGSKEFDFELFDKNIAGLGSELNFRLIHKSEVTPKYGFGISFITSNVFRSFINFKTAYLKKNLSEELEISATRPFQINKKYFGEATYINKQDSVGINIKDTVINIRTESFSTTIGKAFNLSKDSLSGNKLSLAVRYMFRSPLSHLPISDNYVYYPFERRNMILSSISLFKQKYYKSTLIYNFGVTEDVAYGHNITGQFGYENHAYFKRMYGSVSASMGKKYSFGYLYTQGSYGTFFRDKKREQGVIRLYTQYFTPLLQIGKSFHRQFLSLDFTQGLNRLYSEDEFIYFSSLTTFKTSKYDDLAKGRFRFVLNLENNWFTPVTIIGFRPVLFSFVNLGWLGQSNMFHKKDFFSGYGIGLRLRNDNLVFKTLEIKFAWYPNFPQSKFGDYYHFTTQNINVSSNFRPEFPEISSFH